jgi:hypothetical protein
MISSQRIMLLLGYAGLIPFVAPALAVVIDSQYSNLALRIAEAYAFGIISFLTGSWWGMALTRDHGKALLLSNLGRDPADEHLFCRTDQSHLRASRESIPQDARDTDDGCQRLDVDAAPGDVGCADPNGRPWRIPLSTY